MEQAVAEEEQRLQQESLLQRLPATTAAAPASSSRAAQGMAGRLRNMVEASRADQGGRRPGTSLSAASADARQADSPEAPRADPRPASSGAVHLPPRVFHHEVMPVGRGGSQEPAGHPPPTVITTKLGALSIRGGGSLT